jgi:F0F1-type ATP synthase assembly protein I
VIDPRRERMLDSPGFEMAQAPEHSGNLSQRRPDAGPDQRELDRVMAPSARPARTYYETVSFSAAGIELGLSVVIGALFGHWVDGRLGVDPLFMLVLTIAGFAAGVRAMVRAGRRATRARGASNP